MSTEADIVERLRAMMPRSYGPQGLYRLIEEAAIEIARLRGAEVEMKERCAKAALACGNFGDYKREELTPEYGQPRFDMMHSIVNRIRGLAVIATEREVQS